MYQLPAESTNILFEDIWIDGAQSNFQKLSASVTIRRSIVTDAFEPNGSHVQGIFYSGNRDGILRIEESILMRNGFKSNPKTTAWPPTGDQIWSVYSRNLYLSGETRNMDSQFVDSVSLMGASGDQFRPGMKVERNFFYQGYVLMAASGGYDPAPGPTGTVKSNVIQRFKGSGTNDNRGQPGWGVYLMGGANEVDVSDNIVSGAQHPAEDFAVELNGVDWDCGTRYAWQPTSNNRIHSNILDSGTAKGAIRIKDGAAGKCADIYRFPGVVGNAVSDNVMINSTLRASSHLQTGGTTWTTTDTAFSNNRLYANRADAAAALGWRDPNRTLKSYLISQGLPVTSSDGYMEYYKLAVDMRRGRWRPELTSRAIANYIRDGFGRAALQ